MLVILSFVIFTELFYLSAVVCTKECYHKKLSTCLLPKILSLHPFTWVPFNNDLLNLDDELMTRFCKYVRPEFIKKYSIVVLIGLCMF
jgi:hypothetical protein